MVYKTFPMLIALGLGLAAAITAAAAAADNSTGTPVTCTAVRDDVNESARVTCHFSHDVSSVLPVSLSVEFYAKGKTSPVTLVDCDRETLNDSCEVQKGRYSFSKSPDAASNMVLDISNVTENDEGRYLCQMMSKDHPYTSVPCELTSKADPAKMTTDHTTTPSDDEVAEATPDTTVIVVGVLVPVVIIFVAIGIFLCWKRRKGKKSANPEGQGHEGQPLQDAPKPPEKPDDKKPDFSGIPGNDTPNMARGTGAAVTETSETKAPDSAESSKPEASHAVESGEHEARNATGSPDQERPNAVEGSKPHDDEDPESASESGPLLDSAKGGSGEERKPHPPAE